MQSYTDKIGSSKSMPQNWSASHAKADGTGDLTRTLRSATSYKHHQKLCIQKDTLNSLTNDDHAEAEVVIKMSQYKRST